VRVTVTPVDEDYDPLDAVIGIGEGGRKDGADEHDHYIYRLRDGVDKTHPDPSPAEVETMSTVVKVDATGAVTLPAELCRAAGVEPGADLVAEVQAGRIVLEMSQPSLAERIAARARALPPGVLDALPDDLAAQHDHYLYGTPKRPE
jgi:bifunctional DNA-binding transcriptional regulator/antitoxin component of YhaV-PrlF toxin-antitoxin module